MLPPGSTWAGLANAFHLSPAGLIGGRVKAGGAAWLRRPETLRAPCVLKRGTMGLALDRGLAGWVANTLVWLVCGLGALVGTQSACGQTGTDGAIGGQVFSAAGAPVEGALVIARGLETGLVEWARSGSRGEFLVVRLPVGDYGVTVEDAGVILTLPRPVTVRLGGVTEVEARMRPPVAAPLNG